jgi:hypothetical protein
VEALREKERGGSKEDETMFKTKNGACFSSPLPLPPHLNANVHFGRFFLNLTRFWTKLKVLVLCFPDFTENSIVLK